MKKDKTDTILSILLAVVAVVVISSLIFIGIQEKKKMNEWRQEREQEEVDEFMNDLNQWKLDYESHLEELEGFKTDKGRWEGAGFIE